MFRDCTWLENKQEEEEEEKKKNIAPSMCCRSNIHPWCVPWKTRPFSFSTFIRRSFSVRSFVFISRIRRWGISDAWKRVIDFFSPLFPLFHSFDFFFPFFFFSLLFYVFVRQRWLWYVVEQRFLSIIVFLSKNFVSKNFGTREMKIIKSHLDCKTGYY